MSLAPSQVERPRRRPSPGLSQVVSSRLRANLSEEEGFNFHYQGDILWEMIPERVQQRLLEKVTVDNGCHLSGYSTGSHGYSQIGWNENGVRTVRLGHRVAWEIANGAIPADMTIDHICRVRRCINVEHLRLMSNLQNASDNGMATKTHCPKGHEYSEVNTHIYTNPNTGYTCRKCRGCQKESNAERHSRVP